jgi:hypothetical protein
MIHPFSLSDGVIYTASALRDARPDAEPTDARRACLALQPYRMTNVRKALKVKRLNEASNL